MKIRFYCDSGANIHSSREYEFTPTELGFTQEEWKSLSDEQKQKHAEDWANDRLEIGYEEIEEEGDDE